MAEGRHRLGRAGDHVEGDLSITFFRHSSPTCDDDSIDHINTFEVSLEVDLVSSNLVGIGLFTPKDAERLIKVPSGKIVRWLRGHGIGNRRYEALWAPQVDIGDDRVYLGFRDLMEMRAAHALISHGISAIAVRKAIIIAKSIIGDDRPLSTASFKTDGRRLILEKLTENDEPRLIDLFSGQYVFRQIIERSLKDIDYDGNVPGRWWPSGRPSGILVDPARSFGQPIDEQSGVPTAVLAAAAKAEGGVERAARIWSVAPRVIRRAVEFEASLCHPLGSSKAA
jgi:hypothetical protein